MSIKKKDMIKTKLVSLLVPFLLLLTLTACNDVVRPFLAHSFQSNGLKCKHSVCKNSYKFKQADLTVVRTGPVSHYYEKKYRSDVN